jgi:hypothetical protein
MMKVARLMYTASALMLLSGLTTWSYACDKDKASTTSTKTTSSKMIIQAANTGAAACTAEQKAACMSKMSATAAGAACTDKAASAVTASTAGEGCCATKGATTAKATKPAKGMRITAAATPAPTALDNTVYLAGSGGACAAKKNTGATASNQCTGHGMASVAAFSDHMDCEACSDMVDCSGALDAAGAHRQTVRLKNGLMYVYTADSPRTVSAVQAAVARRVERMSRLATAGEKAHLCAECKAMRGAMASGKLNREVVNIEGGTLTLVTSNDPGVVSRLHAMAADQKVAARIKS